MKYVRLTKGLNSKGTLVKPDEIEKNLDYEKDWYVSVFYYNDQHYKQFYEKVINPKTDKEDIKGCSGIEDVVTDKLVFDFDNKFNLDLARYDAIECVSRLKTYGIEPDEIETYFSGSKGFTVQVRLNKELKPEEVSSIAINRIGKGLKTLDKTMYNASRVLRIPGTKHQDTGLYKIPITLDDLQTLAIENIRENAKESFVRDPAPITKPKSDLFIIDKPKESKMKSVALDLSKKPHKWTNCKWSLLLGRFGDQQGERHHVATILAATCRGLGYDKDTTYYMVKSALKKQAKRTGREEFPKEELWKNIIEDSIYGDTWEGGQYTCKKDPWLKDYCEALGDDACETHEEEQGPSVSFEDISSRFTQYAQDFEKNKIQFGLEEFDKHVILATSTLNGLLGQPGAGKTSHALKYLKNTSGRSVPSMFFSMDMGEPILYAKMIQSESSLDFNDVMNLFKTNPKEAKKWAEQTNNAYRKCSMNFRSGLTVPDIKKAIEDQNDINGPDNKVKLVIIDYLECIAGPYSDPIANSGLIANQLKDVANQTQTCILLLLQTQKHSTPEVSDPLMSLKGVKGSSLIEQSMTAIITLWREGYGPEYIEHDKFISFALVKNRFGQLWTDDFGWSGIKGDIYSITEEERAELKDFREWKREKKINELKEKVEDYKSFGVDYKY